MNTGQILRACRKHRKRSIMDLSVVTGVSPSTIGEVERGQRDCLVSTFEKLLDELGYELEVMEMEDI